MSPFQFRAYLGAKFLSDCGTSIDNVILATYVLAVTGRPEAVGLFLAARLGGTVAGSAAAARLADMFRRRSLMIAADLGRAAALVLLLATPTAWQVPAIGLVAVLVGFWNGLFKVALYAEIPAFRGSAQRHGVNSAFTAAEGVAEVVGGLSAAFLLAAFSYGIVFAWDAATYLVSATALVALHRSASASEDTGTTGPTAGLGWGALLRSVSLVLPMILGVRALEAFASGAHNVGFPVLSARYDSENSALLFGLIMAAWGAGRLIVSPLIPRLLGARWVTRHENGVERVFLVATVATFLAFLGVFSAPILPLVIACAVAAGAWDAVTEVAYYSTLQGAPPADRTRLIGASYVVERLSLGAGMLGSSLLLGARPLLEVVAGFYGLAILGAAAALLILVRGSAAVRMGAPPGAGASTTE